LEAEAEIELDWKMEKKSLKFGFWKNKILILHSITQLALNKDPKTHPTKRECLWQIFLA
jgi:hypothetical protein